MVRRRHQWRIEYDYPKTKRLRAIQVLHWTPKVGANGTIFSLTDRRESSAIVVQRS